MKEDVNKHAYKNLEKATSVKMQQQSNSNPSVKETEGRNFLNILMLQFYLILSYATILSYFIYAILYYLGEEGRGVIRTCVFFCVY